MPETQGLDNPNPNPGPGHDPDPGRGTGVIDRSAFSAHDVVADIWSALKLPPNALEALHLPGADHAGPALPSSFKIGILAQGSIALAALTAALLRASQDDDDDDDENEDPGPPSKGHGLCVPRVTVPLDRAVLEFRSEQLYDIDGRRDESAWGTLGGLHRTSDGHVRIHDVFPNHAQGMLALLGLPRTATREDVAVRAAQWRALDLEDRGTHGGGLAIYALRSYAEWDATPQARAVSDEPILLRHIASTSATSTSTTTAAAAAAAAAAGHRLWRPRGERAGGRRCLRGLRVLEMSRVIAAPVAGRTLAAHGADVLWVTSPKLPDIPALDRDLSRGKRSVQLDLDEPADRQTLLGLLATCDVFVQGYRPGSLAARGLSPGALAAANPGIVVANLSAFGPAGPWAGARGFDSLVQACSGMNASEAAHRGAGEAARAMPCQALDHASGHLLAAGVMAALHRRAKAGAGAEGRAGAYVVDVSLAGTMKYLRSLGQYPGASGFELAAAAAAAAAAGGAVPEDMKPGGVAEESLEERATAFGKMRALRHSAEVEGCEVGWERGPSVPGSDEPQWLLDA
ncbi:Formyl-coenzyme A transferase [Escovopsis weberi]|uniref:Formyl-coenzyme A transferase n=1 Tax=Escovopsis weberi TaxID=150374 RepID=A0A0M8N005_ESCWE|nr:Formyl-coenzyme A transferase [Escovopsis weberi]